MGNVHNIKNTNKRSETEISKNRSLYNVVFTVLNHHSSSDQIYVKGNLKNYTLTLYATTKTHTDYCLCLVS